MVLSLLLLGPYQVTSGEVPIPESRARRIEALLAYLALESNISHRRDKLVGLLFPELSEEQARTNLRQTIKRLRVAIGDTADDPYLLVTRETVQFNRASDHFLDTADYQERLDGCSNHRGRRERICPDCMALAGQAITLYRGPFLDGISLADSAAYEEWLLIRRQQFQQDTIIALGQLTDYHERRGEYELATKYARQQISIEPWREEAQVQLMRILAHQGQRSAALHQYEILRDQLWEELAVEPLPETESLRRTIAAATDTRPQNLPSQDRSFIGRVTELSRIRENLVNPDRRLLTLVGSGGSGKTALAVEAGWRVATQYLGPYIHGVFFVPLANVRAEHGDGGGQLNPLVSAVAESIHFSFAGAQDPQAQLFSYLRDRSLLLVLDNVEHLITAGRNFISELLHQTSRPKLLVTSRTRLNLSNEWTLEVAGLPYPKADAVTGYSGDDALTLFVQRARRLVPQFELRDPVDDDLNTLCTRSQVIHICQLLQGMPLGIELAASWVRFLNCREIAVEIKQSLDFLRSSSPELPARQKSLRAVFDYSWALLPPEEQQVLECLSVFAGPFDRHAAVAISQASLSQLSSLLDHSLLQLRESPDVGSHRFEMLEVLRQYAAENLADSSTSTMRDVGDSHARYYLAYLTKRRKSMMGRDQQKALAEVSLELANLRKAWRWAAEHQDVSGLSQALDTLALFYYMHSLFAEGAENIGLAADSLFTIRDDPQNDLLWGRMRTHQGWFNFLRGSQQLGHEQLTESVENLRRHDDPQDLALALGYLAVATYTVGNYEIAGELVREGLNLSEMSGDAYSIGVSSNIQSQLYYRMGQYKPARHFGEQSLALARELDNPWSIGFALINLGRVAYVTGEYKEAETLFREALATRELIGDARGLALCRLYLGDAAAAQGEQAEGQQLWLDSLRFFEEISNLEGMSSALSRLGRIAALQGQSNLAQKHFLKALRLADEAQATPRVLDALTGLANLLSERSPDKAWSIANLVAHHRAATQECRALAFVILASRMANYDNETLPPLSEKKVEQRLAQLVAGFLVTD